MISPKQRDELLSAIKEYGEAEFNAGKELGDYCGSLEPATSVAVSCFEKVINIIHKL